MRSSEVLFHRLVAVLQTLDIDLKNTVFHRELAALPPTLFIDDGSMRKATKADLAKMIEAVCDKIHVLSDLSVEEKDTTHITDGLAMVQSLNETLLATCEVLSGYV